MLNLVAAFLWLAFAIFLFGYRLTQGKSFLIFPALNLDAGWIALLLVGWNLVRWYSRRMGRAEQDALRIAHEARLRRARHHERPPEPDPTFDFTDKPTAPPRNITDRPPSSN